MGCIAAWCWGFYLPGLTDQGSVTVSDRSKLHTLESAWRYQDVLANNIATTTSGLVFVPGTPYEVSAEAAEQILFFAPKLRRARAIIAH